MTLQFDANQQFQLDAVAAITDLFDGQPRRAPEFSIINAGDYGNMFAGHESTELGAGNRLLLAEDKLRENARAIQLRNDIGVAGPASPLDAWELFDTPADRPRSCPHFSVLMETGTGETYVYLRRPVIYKSSMRRSAPGGRFQPERAADLGRSSWPISTGLGGEFAGMRTLTSAVTRSGSLERYDLVGLPRYRTFVRLGSSTIGPVGSTTLPDLPLARARALGHDAAGNLYAMVLIYREHREGTVSWCFIGVSPEGEYLGQLRLPWEDWAGGSWTVTPSGKILELRSTEGGVVLTEYALRR